MEGCHECLRSNELRRELEDLDALIVQYNEMIRAGKLSNGTPERKIRMARRRRTTAAQILLVHHRTHEDSSRPKTRTAGQALTGRMRVCRQCGELDAAYERRIVAYWEAF